MIVAEPIAFSLLTFMALVFIRTADEASLAIRYQTTLAAKISFRLSIKSGFPPFLILCCAFYCNAGFVGGSNVFDRDVGFLETSLVCLFAFNWHVSFILVYVVEFFRHDCFLLWMTWRKPNDELSIICFLAEHQSFGLLLSRGVALQCGQQAEEKRRCSSLQLCFTGTTKSPIIVFQCWFKVLELLFSKNIEISFLTTLIFATIRFYLYSVVGFIVLPGKSV